MAEYRIDYVSDNSGHQASAAQTIASLESLEKVVDRVTAKLKNMTKGADRAMASLAAATTKANAALSSLDGSAKTASISMGKVASSSKVAGEQTAAAGTAVSSLGRRLGGAATNATALGTAITSAGAAAVSVSPMITTLGTSTQATGVAVQGTGANLRTLVKVGAGLSLVSGLAASISEAFKDAREFAHECAEDVLSLEDSIRELRTTIGGKTTTDDATEAVVSLMVASGADKKQTTDFNTIWESTVPAAKKKGNWGLNDDETKDAKVQALRWAVTNGIDAKTMGEIVPAIAISEKITSPNQLLGKIGTMTNLAVEGVGNFGPLMKVYEKLRGTMVREKGGGATKTSEELMAIIGTASVQSGGELAATHDIEQAWRDLSFAKSHAKQDTFKKYGIKGTDDFEARIHKIAPLIEEAQANGVNELDAMNAAGFGNANANKKIIQFVENKGLLSTNIEAAKRSPDGPAMRARNDQFKAEQPNRWAKNAIEAAKLNRGRETKDLEVMRKFAEAQGMNQGGLGRPGMNFFENMVDLKIPGSVPFLGGKSVSQDLLGQEPAREKILDVITSGHILKNIPDAAKRFPDLSAQIDVPLYNRANPTFQPARGERLAEIIRSLSPEERQKVMQSMEKAAQPETAAKRQAAAAGGAGPVPGGALPGPQAMNGGMVTDPAMIDLTRRQLDVLNEIRRNQGTTSGAAAVAWRGPLPMDGGDYSGTRT